MTEVLKPVRPTSALIVHAAPNPFTNERTEYVFDRGMTVLQILFSITGDKILQRHAHVFIGDIHIPKHMWSHVRPKPGSIISIRIVPQNPGGGGGGGKKDPFRTILSIAVIAAAAYAGPAIGGAFKLTGTALKVGSALGSAVVGVAGNLVLNAIAPPSSPSARGLTQLSGVQGVKDSPTYLIQGARNTLRPYAPVPIILGKHRVVPALLAKTYTELVGDQQWFRMALLVGSGPLDISDIKIGTTALANFEHEVEILQGYDADPAPTLFTQNITEVTPDIELKQSEGWQVQTTELDIDEISADIQFKKGLAQFTSNTGKSSRTVTVELEYSPAGADTWTAVHTFTITGKQSNALLRGHRWKVATGQYDVRMRRTTTHSSNVNIVDDVWFSTLRSIKCENPINDTNVAAIILRIRATGKLNGLVDQLNCLAQTICKDWDSGTQTWIERITNNPASLYRYVLQGPGIAKPVLDSRIDLEDLQAFHDRNVSRGFEFNMVVDFKSSVGISIDDICSSARASKALHDGKWGVILDDTKTVPVQMFTERNSWGFDSRIIFDELPHGWRVRFANEEQDNKQDEMIVYADGFDENNATQLENLSLNGITKPDLIWKNGRYHYAVAQERPEAYTIFTDVENVVCRRGDFIRLNHEIALIGEGSARIKVVQSNGTHATGVTLDDAVTMLAGKTYNIRARHKDMTQTAIAVVNTENETFSLTFVTPILLASAPKVQDLIGFGQVAKETGDMIVKRIDPGPNLTAKLTVLDLAPQIQSADSGTIPTHTSNLTQATGINIPLVQQVRSDGTVLLDAPDGSFITRVLIGFRVPSGIQSDITGIRARFRPKDSEGPWLFSTVQDVETGEMSILEVDDRQEIEFQLQYITKDGEEGDFNTLTTHTVIGKDGKPADVLDFSAQQNGNNVNYRWGKHPEKDIKGHELRYMPQGIDFDWASANFLTDKTGGTLILNGGLPPGTWTVGIKAQDFSGNESVNPTLFNITVVNFGNEILSREEQPTWPGTKINFILHEISNKLIPRSKDTDSLADDVFDVFIPRPEEECIYQGPELDLGFDAKGARVWGELTARLGPGETVGAADPKLEIDFKPQGGSYSGFIPWDIGEVDAQFIKCRAKIDNTSGVTVLEKFKEVADVADITDGDTGVVIPIGGKIISFNKNFHLTPRVEVSAQGSTALIATFDLVNTTTFKAFVFNTSDEDVGGTINWDAIGA